jgi:serine protease Do
VVGINSAIYSRTGGYMGVSFAIPIEVALDVTKQLRETGKVTRGRLGAQIQALTPELAKSFKLDSTNGVLVASVEPGSPADDMGVAPGDVVVAVNQVPTPGPREFQTATGKIKITDGVVLDINRQGRQLYLSYTDQ